MEMKKHVKKLLIKLFIERALMGRSGGRCVSLHLRRHACIFYADMYIFCSSADHLRNYLKYNLSYA